VPGEAFLVQGSAGGSIFSAGKCRGEAFLAIGFIVPKQTWFGTENINIQKTNF